MENSAFARLQVIELARSGVDEASDALHQVVVEARSRHVELPLEIEGYEHEVRGSPLRSLAEKSGPKSIDHMMRDLVWSLVVAGVCDRYGLSPLQRSVRTISGCGVVAEAAFGVNDGRSYAAVARAWKRFGRAMPTLPGWASK